VKEKGRKGKDKSEVRNEKYIQQGKKKKKKGELELSDCLMSYHCGPYFKY
jgi:hypothetical protein